MHGNSVLYTQFFHHFRKSNSLFNYKFFMLQTMFHSFADSIRNCRQILCLSTQFTAHIHRITKISIPRYCLTAAPQEIIFNRFCGLAHDTLRISNLCLQSKLECNFNEADGVRERKSGNKRF